MRFTYILLVMPYPGKPGYKRPAHYQASVARARKRMVRGYMARALPPLRRFKFIPGIDAPGGGSIGRYRPDGPEMKFDNTINGVTTTPLPSGNGYRIGTAYTDSVSIHFLTDIHRGSAPTERIGQKVNMHSLSLRIIFGKDADGADGTVSNCTIRYMVVMHVWQNGGLLQPDDVLDDNSGIPVVAKRRINLYNNYKVLLDRTFDTCKEAGINNGTSDETISRYHNINLKGVVQTYGESSTTGAYTDVVKNGLWLLIFASDDGFSAGYHGWMAGHSARVRFTG